MRPLPILPRGPRRVRTAHARHLLGCPRIAPDWELNTLQALLKPQLKHRILHKSPRQRWPLGAATQVERTRQIILERLGYDPRPHFPQRGDFWFLIEVPEEQRIAARAFGLVLSKRLRHLWMVNDRIYIRDGGFFRRERGYKLNIVPATNVHLPRETRAALQGVI